MEQLHNGFTLHIPQGAFPLSTDSMLLADFVQLPKNAAVVDLGSGCGTLGILLCANDPNCSVIGYELTDLSHQAALENIRRNNLQSRLFSICANLKTIPQANAHVCISNPPYYSGGPASAQTPTARRDDECTTEDLMQAASKALRYGGDFYLVHKPEKLATICTLGGKFGLEAKHLRLIRHHDGGPIILILLKMRKGGKPGLQIDEKTLFLKDNTPTEYYRSVYHIP